MKSLSKLSAAELEEVRKLGASVLRNTAVKRTIVPTVARVPTNLSPQCECGKQRDGRHAKCAACRKRAYRERSR